LEPRRCKKKLTPHEEFAYRLCRDLGGRHPDHFLTEITWEQFIGWQRFYLLEAAKESGEESAPLTVGDALELKAKLDAKAQEIRQRRLSAGG
jgi:hypothetical protein